MTCTYFFAKRRTASPSISEPAGVPLLVTSLGIFNIDFEIRAYTLEGLNCGAIHTCINREEARTLVRNLAQWLDETEREARKLQEGEQ